MTVHGQDELTGSDQAEQDTVMWEVRAVPARTADLVAWVHGSALPGLLAQAGCRQVDVYAAADERVVVIARFDGPAGRLADPPAELLRRPPHSWSFQHLSTHRPGDV
jgi:hypothetical protein